MRRRENSIQARARKVSQIIGCVLIKKLFPAPEISGEDANVLPIRRVSPRLLGTACQFLTVFGQSV
jgi:hypothetical protein